jgi:rhodanese-related sulfurtransferase
MKNYTKILLLLTFTWLLSACSGGGEAVKNTLQSDVAVEKKELWMSTGENLDISKLESVWIDAFTTELAKKDATIIDLRTTAELVETGMISGAQQIDYYGSDFKKELWALDKEKKYLIYCRSGGRSWRTLWMMKRLWFTHVIELGGWMNGWKAAGKNTDKFWW